LDLRSKGEAVAAQTPEIAIAGSGGLDAGQELIGSVETTLFMALSAMRVLENRDTGVSSFASVQWCPIPAVNLYG